MSARAREIALTLTSWPSVTGSADEAAFAAKLAQYLHHLDKVWTSPIPGDPRSNVFALKRGRGRRTIVLTGHFDVVPVGDYGALEPLAFSAERLLPEIVARLRRSGENPLALADFESGEFLPGRGLLDMKAGLAAGIAAMEAYTGDANLLFLAVSDEEERSAGARAAAPLLAGIAKEHGLPVIMRGGWRRSRPSGGRTVPPPAPPCRPGRCRRWCRCSRAPTRAARRTGWGCRAAMPA